MLLITFCLKKSVKVFEKQQDEKKEDEKQIIDKYI